MARVHEFLLFLGVILLLLSSSSAVYIGKGTEFNLTETNSTISAGQNYSFRNITVYGSKVSFQNYNISLESNYTGNVYASLDRFNPNTSIGETVVDLNITSPAKETIEGNFTIQNIPDPEGIYNSSEGVTYETSNISISFQTGIESQVYLKHIDERSGSDEDDSGNGSTTNEPDPSSSSGSGGGGGGGLVSDTDPNKNFTVPKVRFERENLSVEIRNKSEKVEQIILQNEGNGTSYGNIEIKSLPITDIRKNPEVRPNEFTTLNPVFTRNGNTSGHILYRYNNKTARLQVNVEVYSDRPKIDSKLNYSSGKLNYSINVSKSLEGRRFQIAISDGDGETVYERNVSVSSGSGNITGRVEGLEASNYTINTKPLPENAQKANNSSKELTSGDKYRSMPYAIIGIGLGLILILGVFSRVKRKNELQKYMQASVNETQREVDKRNEGPEGSTAEFEEINGIGDDLSRKLSETFGSLESLQDASIEDLEEVEGIGKKKAKNILEQAE